MYIVYTYEVWEWEYKKLISFIIGLYFVISDVLITIIVSFMLAICIFGFLSLTDSSKIIDSGKEAINKIIPKRRLPILDQISIGVNVIPIWIICFILVYLAYVLLGKQLDLGLEAIAEIGIRKFKFIFCFLSQI